MGGDGFNDFWCSHGMYMALPCTTMAKKTTALLTTSTQPFAQAEPIGSAFKAAVQRQYSCYER